VADFGSYTQRPHFELRHQSQTQDDIVNQQTQIFWPCDQDGQVSPPIHCSVWQSRGKQSQSRPRKRWLDNVTEDCKRCGWDIVEATRLAKDRQYWRSCIRLSQRASATSWQQQEEEDQWCITKLNSGALSLSSISQAEQILKTIIMSSVFVWMTLSLLTLGDNNVDGLLLLTDLAVGAIKPDGTATSVCVSYRDTASTIETRPWAARMLSTVVHVDARHSVRYQTDHALVDRELKWNTTCQGYQLAFFNAK